MDSSERRTIQRQPSSMVFPPHNHYNYNYNYNNYYHMHFSSHCPVHNHLIQPHFHHHPSCHHSHQTIQGDNDAVLEKEDGEFCVDRTMQHDNELIVKEEDEEEPVFVLTDEWRDFFAKSDAKRKAAKKQAKKKGKQQITT